MSLGNRKGGGTNGNKNSGFHYELTNLQLLEKMRALLASIASTNGIGKDFEVTLVKDANDVIYVEARTYDNDAGDWTAVEYYLPGTTTPAAPAPALPVTYIPSASETTLEAIRDLIARDVWDLVPGNSIIYNYYTTGLTPAGNPSGNKNLETIEYWFTGGLSPFITQTYTWDADDDVLTTVAS